MQMNFLFHLTLIIFLLSSPFVFCDNSSQGCKISKGSLYGSVGATGATGATGPSGGETGSTGATGATGSQFSNVASVYQLALTAQNVPTGALTPVHFPYTQITSAAISHPVSDDDTKFQVHNSGTYLIEWSFTITPEGGPSVVDVSLADVTTGTFFAPDPQEVASAASGSSQNTSHHVVLALQANQILQLQVQANTTGVTIGPATFSIIQVGP